MNEGIWETVGSIVGQAYELAHIQVGVNEQKNVSIELIAGASVEWDDYEFKQEARNGKEGLMEISEWPDSKWESIAAENGNGIV